MRNLAIAFSILSTAAQADDVLIMPSNRVSPGQVIAGRDLKMILTTSSPCYITGVGDELPYHGMIPNEGGTEAACWAFTGNHTITVMTSDRRRTLYDQASLPRAEGVGGWQFLVKPSDEEQSDTFKILAALWRRWFRE